MEYKIKFKNGFKMTTTDGIEAFAAEFAELRDIEKEDIQSYCEVCAQVCYEDETEGGTPYGHICFFFICLLFTFLIKREIIICGRKKYDNGIYCEYDCALRYQKR